MLTILAFRFDCFVSFYFFVCRNHWRQWRRWLHNCDCCCKPADSTDFFLLCSLIVLNSFVKLHIKNSIWPFCSSYSIQQFYSCRLDAIPNLKFVHRCFMYRLLFTISQHSCLRGIFCSLFFFLISHRFYDTRSLSHEIFRNVVWIFYFLFTFFSFFCFFSLTKLTDTSHTTVRQKRENVDKTKTHLFSVCLTILFLLAYRTVEVTTKNSLIFAFFFVSFISFCCMVFGFCFASSFETEQRFFSGYSFFISACIRVWNTL